MGEVYERTYGLAGTVAAVMYGAVNYRKYRRAGMSTSVFLMQFRVIAQSMVVGCMTLGVGYTLVSDYVLKHRQPAKTSPRYFTDQVQDYRQMESNFWKE
ncbi:Hypp6438 [Branchiostoma lanceolatum]|uniref:Hypp6438 protein n=1 Tax=Branchiostoma lanceolatum TaxID=7740 RepID=A0A8J9YUC5_BRALA|nr:Hypp6438 [Branchiostoma lanceolatum]